MFGVFEPLSLTLSPEGREDQRSVGLCALRDCEVVSCLGLVTHLSLALSPLKGGEGICGLDSRLRGNDEYCCICVVVGGLVLGAIVEDEVGWLCVSTFVVAFTGELFFFGGLAAVDCGMCFARAVGGCRCFSCSLKASGVEDGCELCNL